MMERRRMDKHGWLKVLEAVIAITLLIGFLLYLMSTSAPKKDISRAVNEKEIYILDLISQNDSFRDDIVMFKDNTYINATIVRMIPASWDFETRICNLSDICEGLRRPLDRDVYANEVVISSTDTVYEPKKLRLFVWAHEGSKNPTSFPPMSIIFGGLIPTGSGTEEMDPQYQCGGGAQNTPFDIVDIPITRGVKSLIIILRGVTDPSEVNWMAWDIPVSATSLSIPSSSTPLPLGSIDAGYSGPCPPPHIKSTYRLTVYALNIDSINLAAAGADINDLTTELTNHASNIRATATYDFNYTKGGP